LKIKRLIEAKFRPARRKLIIAHALQINTCPSLIFTEQLLYHYLIDNVPRRESHQSKNRKPEKKKHDSHCQKPVNNIGEEGKTPLESVNWT
jgi:hypothetical protein